MQILSRIFRIMWKIIHFLVMLNLLLGFYGVNTGQHVIQPCLLLSSLGHNHCTPSMWSLTVLSLPSTYQHRWGGRLRGKARSMVPFTQGMSVPHLVWLNVQEEHIIAVSIGLEKTLISMAHFCSGAIISKSLEKNGHSHPWELHHMCWEVSGGGQLTILGAGGMENTG